MTASLYTLPGLRTELSHTESGTVITTSAPRDNQGDGAAFSPTDLLAAALLSCAATTLCIVARRLQMVEPQITGQIHKVMTGPPRRIGALRGKLTVQNLGYDDKQRKELENAARFCPVQRSLSPDVELELEIEWVP